MTQTAEIAQASPKKVEWLTVFLIFFTYAALAAIMWFHEALPFWFIVPVAGYLVALHGSLQHEAAHGHPTRDSIINEALVFANFSLWFPYRRYKRLHLVHHNDENLTHPALDPESLYMFPDDWAKLPGLWKLLYTFNNTLAGRMIMGPFVATARFWSDDLRKALRGEPEVARAWVLHAIACAITLTYALAICGIPLWKYLMMFVWPGIALSLIRSFCEHQAVADVGERTVVVEAGKIFSLMFLNNNLHVAHHTRPRMAWYELPAYYRAERETLLKQNNGYLMNGYREIFRRYFFKPKEPVAYPDLSYFEQHHR
jgi:fatty acid desaturase